MQSHTRIMELLVSLWFRRSQMHVLQSDANVGTGTLACGVVFLSRERGSRPAYLDFVAILCHTPAPSELPPRHHISGMTRKPMRLSGTHIAALSAASARPDCRSSGWCAMRAINGGFQSQQKQPEQGSRQPD